MNCEICNASPVEVVQICGVETKLCNPHAIAWRASGKKLELVALVLDKARAIIKRRDDAELEDEQRRITAERTRAEKKKGR